MSVAISLAFMLFLLALFGWAVHIRNSSQAQRAWERLLQTSAGEHRHRGREVRSGFLLAPLRLATRHPEPVLFTAAALLAYVLTGMIPLALASGVIALSVWRWSRKRAMRKRRRLMAEQVVELVEALIQPLRAGLSLPGALQSAAGEVPEPLGAEVRRAVSDIQLGLPLDAVLDGLAERCGGRDLRLVSITLLQQRAAGGNLPQLLETLKGVMRDRSMLTREVQTLTAQGRLSGYLVASLPAAFLALECLFSRSAVQALLRSPLGWTILAIGLGLEILGLLTIRRICNLREGV